MLIDLVLVLNQKVQKLVFTCFILFQSRSVVKQDASLCQSAWVAQIARLNMNVTRDGIRLRVRRVALCGCGMGPGLCECFTSNFRPSQQPNTLGWSWRRALTGCRGEGTKVEGA